MKRVENKRKRGKKGEYRRAQLQISFGMIFSVILIIAFIAVAIYAIIIFLGIKECAETGMFKNNLQEEIDRAWNSPETSATKEFSLPSKIKEVCFINSISGKKGSSKDYYDEATKYEVNNLFFWPLKKACSGMGSFDIKHVNITEITKENNPKCIKNMKEKVTLKIEKGFYEALVKIS